MRADDDEVRAAAGGFVEERRDGAPVHDDLLGVAFEVLAGEGAEAFEHVVAQPSGAAGGAPLAGVDGVDERDARAVALRDGAGASGGVGGGRVQVCRDEDVLISSVLRDGARDEDVGGRAVQHAARDAAQQDALDPAVAVAADDDALGGAGARFVRDRGGGAAFAHDRVEAGEAARLEPFEEDEARVGGLPPRGVEQLVVDLARRAAREVGRGHDGDGRAVPVRVEERCGGARGVGGSFGEVRREEEATIRHATAWPPQDMSVRLIRAREDRFATRRPGGRPTGGCPRRAEEERMRALAPSVTEGPRADILDVVRRNPGVHLRSIERRTDLPLGQVLYHLDRLERMGLVGSSRDQGFRRYFATGDVSRGEKPILMALRHEVPRRLILHLLQRPGLQHKDLQPIVGTAGSTLSFHLSRLVAAGVLTRERVDGGHRYAVADPDTTRRELIYYRASFQDPEVDAFVRDELARLFPRRSVPVLSS